MPDDAGSAVPNESSLYQAALTYLARYAATQDGLRRVLHRRVDRWARTQPDAEAAEVTIRAAREAADQIVERLAQAGAVSDTEFAKSRARRLVRGGQSSRSVQMKLVAKGVSVDLARSAASVDSNTALASALVLARKRRIGPYRAADDADASVRVKEMAVLARAGFSRDIAELALGTDREEADARIFELRR